MTTKVAVISGGCGQIGSAAAARLAEQHMRVFVLTRGNLDTAQTMLASLPNQQLQHQALLVDVRDTKQIIQARDQILELAGRCDVLINAAGISLPTSTPMDTSDDIFDAMISTNLRGTWVMIREFYSLLVASGDALVINMSSVASIAPRPNSLGYSVSKAGINVMTECLAKSLGPNIRFVAIAPCTLTKGTSGQPLPSKEFHDQMREKIPLNKLCTAEDVADVIESLVTKIKFYNGHLVVLDGGMTL